MQLTGKPRPAWFPNIRLLVLDIDQTLVGDSGQITESVMRSIQAAQARGVEVAITTMSHAEVLSLHHLTTLPAGLQAEIFREYPAFKLGVTRSVRHYAELLAPLAAQLISNDADHDDWVLTAPAVTASTPAAANLLCWELFELLKRDLPSGRRLALLDLEHDKQSAQAMDWKDPNKSQDYAQLDFEDRVKERERLSRALVPDERLRGRAVLFVNDILVTGAQQHTMQQYFDRARAACVKWLYVIEVDRVIGRAEPKLEWQINFAPFDELLRIVCHESIQFTGKCVQKLMHLSTSELDRVLRALNSERRARLLELAAANGFSDTDGFQDQVELLKSYVANGTGTTASGAGKR